jgi:purine nucleoside phosphorylase
VARLGLIAGSSLQQAALPEGPWELIRRHDVAGAYALPHRIDHLANLGRLRGAGCDRVLAVSSVGGLRSELAPGTLICPDDFIALDSEPASSIEGPGAHRVPGFDQRWRGEVVGAFTAAGVEVGDGGIYWQTRGPRLETRAEVRLIAEHADVVGMTVASECVIAGELGLEYCAVCVVDNLANGIGQTRLTLTEIEDNRTRNAARLSELLAVVVPKLAASAR